MNKINNKAIIEDVKTRSSLSYYIDKNPDRYDNDIKMKIHIHTSVNINDVKDQVLSRSDHSEAGYHRLHIPIN